MIKLIRRLIDDRAGATAIEYALVAALIAGVLVAAVTTLGTNLNGRYEAVAASFP